MSVTGGGHVGLVLAACFAELDAIFICVGTPSLPSGDTDLTKISFANETTEWPEFALLGEEFNLMKSKVIIEGNGISSCRDVEGICW